MKKFLSLLLTLALATAAYAECAFYIDDFEVKRSEIGTELELTVKATFSARVSGWDLEIEYPEHMIPTYVEAGEDMKITYYNSRGKEATSKASLYGAAEPFDHLLSVLSDAGFWQDPDGEDPNAWVTYGVVKWEGGVYEDMLLLCVEIEEGFEGGDIILHTTCAAGDDTRGGTIKENGDHKQLFDRVCHVSLQAITEKPEITYTMDEDEAIITATGEGEVILYVNGVAVENPYTIARGEEDVTYTITATAQEEGKVISDVTKLVLTVPAKPEPVYGVGLKKIWSVNMPDQMPEGLATNDMRQGFGMNGKFYVNSKKNEVDSLGNVLAVPTIYVFDENGRIETTYPGGLNCGITRDEAGNLVISDAQFPGAWNEAKIRVINPETKITKEYTVPAECGIDGRCDFLGFAKGNLMEDGEIYLVGTNNTGISIMTITGGDVNTDDSRLAPCDGISAGNATIIANYYKDINDEDALLYVNRSAAPVKIAINGEELTATTFALPNKGANNGAFPFVWNDKELFLYPTLPNYLDGFAIAEADAAAPLYYNDPISTANPNGIQCNWLNAEVDEDGVTVYQYVPGAYVAVYRIGEFERTQMPEITYEITEDAVIVTATGSANVKLYIDGKLVENPCTIARGEEEVTVMATATAQKTGKIISETAEQEIVIPALPAKTDMPVITFNTTDEAVEITANGEGEVLMYVDGEPVENPCTIERTEEAFTITVTATAQEEGKRISDEATLTLEIPALLPKTDMPVITFNTTDEAVEITATGEGEVKMYVNGEPVENPCTIERTEEAFTITVTATAKEDGKRISDEATLTLDIPALLPKTDMPVITFNTTDEAVEITANGEGEVLMYVDGAPVDNPCTIERTEEAFTVTVTATAKGENKRISDVATLTLEIPALLPKTDAPLITFETTDDAVTITATGEGEVLLYANGQPVSNPYTVARGEEDFNITITATAKGENKRISDPAYLELVIPAYQVTDEPVIDVETTDDEVIITASGDGTVLLYVDGELVDNPYTIARDEEKDIVITVMATAKEEGKLMSYKEMEITVPMKDNQSVDELLGNKTVDNVRYFNMAGQEMTEVNGATIVVTTYTDGTRSVVKVIK